MTTRCLTRQVANHVTLPHLLSAVSCNVRLHTAPTYLDLPERQSTTAPGNSNAATQQAATPAASQHNQSGNTEGKVLQVPRSEHGSGLQGRAGTLTGSAQGLQAHQQRRSPTDQGPGTGTPRQHQSRGDFTDRRGSHDRAAGGAQDWRPSSNRLDVQSQRASTPQGSNFRGQPNMTGQASGSRPAFIDRSKPGQGPRPAFIDRSQGTRPAFIDRSKPDQASRPAFIDRSGAAHRHNMPDQRQRPAWQTNRQGPHSQQGRPAPGNMQMPLPEVPDADDPDQQAFQDSNRKTRTRRATTSSSFRTERAAPGSRAGGPTRGAQANIPAAFDDDLDSEYDGEQQEGVSENFLERMEYTPRGVPASWKDHIQDDEVRHHGPARNSACNTCSAAFLSAARS